EGERQGNFEAHVKLLCAESVVCEADLKELLMVNPHIKDDGPALRGCRRRRGDDDAALRTLALRLDRRGRGLELRAEVFEFLDLCGRQFVQVLARKERGRQERRRREDEGELVCAGVLVELQLRAA